MLDVLRLKRGTKIALITLSVLNVFYLYNPLKGLSPIFYLMLAAVIHLPRRV